MAWRRPGKKPLSEPMMVVLPTHISVTFNKSIVTQTPAHFIRSGWADIPALFRKQQAIQINIKVTLVHTTIPDFSLTTFNLWRRQKRDEKWIISDDCIMKFYQQITNHNFLDFSQHIKIPDFPTHA